VHNEAGKRRWLDALAIFVARDVPFVLVGVPLVLLLIPSGWGEAGIYTLSVLFSQLLVIAIQAGIHRKRPFQREHLHPLFHLRVATTSIPSGHASLCAAVLFSLWVFFGGGLYVLVGALVSAAVLLARVYAGLHYWSDILAGLLLGGIVAYSVFSLLVPYLPVPL
jgi:undecaprenyl-diphosphatase